MTDSVARPFRQVDVFGSGPFSGNPVAVVHDAEGLTGDEMHAIARWTNLSETTFLLPPDDPGADYRVRIFTPVDELPFAGHPTLGTAHAWTEAGGTPTDPDTVVQECGVGLVTLRREPQLAFAAPPLMRSGPVDAELTAAVLAALDLAPDDVRELAWVDNGPGWVGVLLDDASRLAALRPRVAADADLFLGVVALLDDDPDAALEVRAFFPAGDQMAEDPVTGSLNASVAQWLLGLGLVEAPYVARQGTVIGRRGRVGVDQDDDGTIWVGGATTTAVTGELRS